MHKISLDFAEPGVVLARNIYSSDGRILLSAGVTLTPNFIHRLHEFGIPAIYVKSAWTNDLEIPEVVSEQIRRNADDQIRKSFQKIQLTQNPAFEPKQIKKVVCDIIDEVLANPNMLYHAADIRSFDSYTFGHSVNVAILALMTGITMGYNELQLHDLACGALLHDIGKMLIPIELLNKPGLYSAEERLAIQKHAEHGFSILRKQRIEVSLLSAHVAFQHHERFDGTGYPRGLKGSAIHEYARIVMIADIYDALVSDRVYHRGLFPYEAYEKVMAISTSELDPEITGLFLQNIAIYPIGSTVSLSTGEIGVIIDVPKAYPTRPVVRCFIDQSGMIIPKKYEVNLMKALTVFVTKILTEDEIRSLPTSIT
ncbi:HD-GYP domain-containing protein [Heliophilum fasciatum]|uniref:Metal dependent phosphohydrolase n=1 Tax=Heliophilum fasciatum TaxID=35700 RepID=A0A4R2RJW0_9FIRM|nr:HD-GYP domain-containing protein [Heliophilum fasciatum]MCW2278796.1 putative nucleotidyltransferase with HDIG domain [Heliophilum fasciatum]TCP62467.1 metal dependent phosphohydrolase [Heliophilum fasciatum]